MTWWRWRRKLEQESDEAVRRAERLRDHAEEQQRQVERITPRVDAIVGKVMMEGIALEVFQD